MKTTLKEIRTFAQSCDVTNITDLHSSDLQALASAHSFTTIVYSVGMYGLNGKVVRDEDGKLYAITRRTTAIFCI